MKTKTLISLFAIALAFVACKKSETDPEPVFTPELKLDKTEKIAMPAEGGNVNLKVTANISWTATVSNQDVATVSPAAKDITDKKSAETAVTVTVKPNEGLEARTATLTFKAEGCKDIVINIEQAASEVETVFEVLDGQGNPITEAITLDGSGDEVGIYVNANVSWTATASEDWLAADPASFEATGTEAEPTAVIVSAEANPAELRTATITFTAEGVDPIVVTVNQTASIPFTAEIDAMSVSEYVGQPLPAYPDYSCIITYVGMPSSPVVDGGCGVWEASVWTDIIADWDANKEEAIAIIDEYGNPFTEEDLELVNELEDEENMAYYVWSDLDPATEYIYVAKLVDEKGRVWIGYALHTTDAAPEPANWELLGTGKYREGHLSGLFNGLEAKEIDVKIYYDPDDAHHFAMFNPYGPDMLLNWWYNSSVTEEMLMQAKGVIWDDCYYEFTINDDNTVDMPQQWIGLNDTTFGAIEAGIDPAYDPQGHYSAGVVELEEMGATIFLPNDDEGHYYYYGNYDGMFRITMPSINASKAASFTPAGARKCGKANKIITRKVGFGEFTSAYCKPISTNFVARHK